MPRGRFLKIDPTEAEDDFIKEIVGGVEPNDGPPSCWHCGSYNVVTVRIDDDEGMAEYCCRDCDKYFVAEHRDLSLR